MSDERESDRLPVYADPRQTALPGFGKEINRPPPDWRKWSDGKGTKLDAPKFKGPEFTGKIIPPFVDVHGKPIALGTYQVMRTARSEYVVVDWSQPIDEASARLFPSPIRGRPLFTSRNSKEAIGVMVLLHQKSEDAKNGLPEDPAPQSDLKGKPIALGTLSVRRYARGKRKGDFVVVDAARPVWSRKRELGVSKTLRAATLMMVKLHKQNGTPLVPEPLKKKMMVGAPIQFSVPDGIGGGGSVGWTRREKIGIESRDVTWQTVVRMYARTGKWCRTAELLWPGGKNRPEGIEGECIEARKKFLMDQETSA